MFCAKRRFIENPVAHERPIKRQVTPIVHSIDITGASSTPRNDAISLLPLTQSIHWSPSDSDSVDSGTPLPKTPGPADEVCFGMICGIKTQFLDDPSIASIRPNVAGLSSSYYQLQIIKKRIHILQAGEDAFIAILNSQTSKVLQELDNRFLVRYNVYVAADEWDTKIRSFMTLGKSACLDVDIYFFGCLSNSLFAGKIMSDTGHFLQPPDFLDSSIPYENPHEISFPSMSNVGTPISIPMLEPSALSNLSMDMMNTVLGRLDHLDDLEGLDVDRIIITTELKPHQRKALDFIAQRESPQTLDCFSLFKKCVGLRNRTFYEHIIIGCKKPERPPEDFGGIIADEMGLGKTLTMISAIARTLAISQNFPYEKSGPEKRLDSMKRTKATLIICPAVLLIDGWLGEISKHVAPGSLKCSKYHGTSKATEADIMDSDVVLTTYATLISDSHHKGGLHSFHWFRIVIDEAHSIRHQQTKQFRAVVSLSARYRWCLTGTPIQNVLNDLGALVRFLRVPQMDGPPDFLNYVAGPIEMRQAFGLERLRNLLQCICLRRTKDILQFPEPDTRTELVQFTQEERTRYCCIGEEHRNAINQAIERRNCRDASSGLFRAILRLRIFCNSGLCGDSRNIESITEETLSLNEQEDQASCSYCSCDITSVGEQDSASSYVLLSCSHLLCIDCISRSKQVYTNSICCIVCGTTCPSLDSGQTQISILEEPPLNLKGYSSKLQAVLQDVMLNPTEKCIIFSSWKNSIQLVASYLTVNLIPVCVVDGSVPLPERRRQISQFQGDPTIRALIMTLGTGAVGLNLTIASRVHILEPQWNPFVEKQAIGRVMRLGQEKKVTIVRYIVENSVEQYIQTRQKKKLYLAQLGWDSGKTEPNEEKLQKVIEMKSSLFI